MPFDSATPMPTMFRLWPTPGSATMAVVFDVPMSRPTRYRSFRATPPPLPFPCRGRCGPTEARRPGAGLHPDDHPLAKPEIHVLDGRHSTAVLPREFDVRLQPLDEPLVAQPD